jgi:hypothetical protein
MQSENSPGGQMDRTFTGTARRAQIVGDRPDRGSVRVMGIDPAAGRDALHLVVGAQLQSSALQASCGSARSFGGMRLSTPIRADAGELMEAMGLAGKRRSYYRSLSGGQRLGYGFLAIPQ